MNRKAKLRTRPQSSRMPRRQPCRARRPPSAGDRGGSAPPAWESAQGRIVFLVIALASVYGVFRIVGPFLHCIILAVLLASLGGPVHQRILRRVGDRANVAAFLSVLLVFLLLLAPTLLFLGALVKQGMQSVESAGEWLSRADLQGYLANSPLGSLAQHPWLEKLRELVRQNVPALSDSLEGVSLTQRAGSTAVAALRAGLETLGKQVVPLLSATGSLLSSFLIMLFVMFYVFRDGASWLQSLQHLSPLSTSQEKALLDRIKEVNKAVVLGTLLTAVAQGMAGMIGFRIVGIPALFWGTMLGVASIIPLVGTALIWVPAAGYLFLTGHTWQGVFITVWGGALISNIDTLLRPVLMGGKTGLSSVAVFFAILGGIKLFGPMGVIYGPLVFGLCAVCMYIYEIENSAYLDGQDRL